MVRLLQHGRYKVVLKSNLEDYIWQEYVNKQFLKDVGFIDMYVKSYDTWLYRFDNDGFYFQEKELGPKKDKFYRLEYLKRYMFPDYNGKP